MADNSNKPDNWQGMDTCRLEPVYSEPMIVRHCPLGEIVYLDNGDREQTFPGLDIHWGRQVPASEYFKRALNPPTKKVSLPPPEGQ
jgi:hypothetical protein